MESTVEVSLLEKEQRSPWLSHKKKIIATGVCMSMGMVFAANSQTLTTWLHGSRVGLRPMQMDDYDFGSPACFKFTGGTCNIQECAEKRHSSCLGGFLDHYCACEGNQGCVGGDGNCWSNVTQYEKLASGFRLKNVKYDNYYMYAPAQWFENQLRVYPQTSRGDDQYAADTWTLYRVPGKMWGTENKKTGYMIQNDKYPDYAAGVMISKLVAITQLPVGSTYEVRIMNGKTMGFDPMIYMQWICRNKDNSIRIDGYFGSVSWSIHHLSWEVVGWFWSDPGPGGYWIPDPKLPYSVMQSFEEC